MALDIAALKAACREIVHSTFRLAAEYRDASDEDAEPIAVNVRWHNKITPRGNHGDLLDLGYADVIEGIDEIIFDDRELTEFEIELKRGDTVTLTAPRFNDTVLRLENRQPRSGPLEVIWRVVVAE